MKNIHTLNRLESLPLTGWSKRKIRNELAKRLQSDYSFDNGRIIGSMCTKPNQFGRSVYAQYLDKNLGDIGLFPNTAQIEQEVIQMLGTLLNFPQASGNIVSGGTEANILALWAYRNAANFTKNEVILPITAHYSFDKAADLLNLKLVKIHLNNNFQINVKAVKRAINEKTLAIVGNAGSTDLGVIDPIPELSEIALAHNLYLHIDAAFGGFVLPFLNSCNVPIFDFRLSGVSSITIDPHKMGLAPIPAGTILFRNSDLYNHIHFNVSYLSGGKSSQTLLGTRPGASAIATWGILKFMGIKGYKNVVKRCLKLTRYFAEAIEAIPHISCVTKPIINVVGIKSDAIDITELAMALRQKGWMVSLFPKHIRIVIMPHIKLIHINKLIKDLKSIISQYA